MVYVVAGLYMAQFYIIFHDFEWKILEASLLKVVFMLHDRKAFNCSVQHLP